MISKTLKWSLSAFNCNLRKTIPSLITNYSFSFASRQFSLQNSFKNNFCDTKIPPSEQQLKKQGKQFYQNQVADIMELQSTKSWNQIISNADKPILVDFYADWCGPCKKMTPLLQKKVKESQGKFRLLKVNIDNCGELSRAMGIKAVPTFYIMYNQKAVDVISGQLTQQQLDKFLESIDRISKYDQLEEEVINQIQQAQEQMMAKQWQRASELLQKIDTKKVKEEFGFVRDIFLALTYHELKKISHLKSKIQILQKNEAFYLESGDLKVLYQDILDKYKILQENPIENTKISQLKKQLDANHDLNIKYELAVAYQSSERLDEALDICMEIVKQNKNWEDKKANKLILQIFKNLGNSSPITQKYRKIYQRTLN